MKLHVFRFFMLILTAHTGSTWAQINCSLAVTNVAIAVNTTQSSSDMSADITVNCDRPGNQNSNPAQETYTVAIGPGLASNKLTDGKIPATQLPYQIYKDPSYATNPWTIASPSAPFTTAFPNGNARSFQDTLRYYFRIPTPTTATAGSYQDTITVTLNTSPGNVLKAQTTLSPTATIASSCILSSPPGTLSLNYTSFSTSQVTASTDFQVSCTNGQSYTMALDNTSGTLLGLNYTLALSSTGTIIGNGFGQLHSVTGTIAANQAGNCTAGTCLGSQPRTVTISY